MPKIVTKYHTLEVGGGEGTTSMEIDKSGSQLVCVVSPCSVDGSSSFLVSSASSTSVLNKRKLTRFIPKTGAGRTWANKR